MAGTKGRTRNERSRQSVLRSLRQRGLLSRAELARATGLSRSTVSMLVTELVGEGLLVEAGTRVPPNGAKAGRPGAGIMLNPDVGEAIGIDFGFRHVRVIVVNVTHAVRVARKALLPVDYAPEQGLDVAVGLVRDAMAETGLPMHRVLGVGVSLPCPYDQRTSVPTRSSVIPVWAGVQVAEELSQRLELPVLADNDANLSAMAEHMWGAGRGCTEMLYLKLHSGVGGALITNGQLARGVAGGTGEIGHMVVDSGGPLCRCGNRGCLESYVGLATMMRLLEPQYGSEISFCDLVAMANRGDRGCRRVLNEAGHIAGTAVGALCNILNPERVIVGGALAEAGDLVMAPLREAAHASSLPLASSTVSINVGELGPQASALGAVALVLHDIAAEPSRKDQPQKDQSQKDQPRKDQLVASGSL